MPEYGGNIRLIMAKIGCDIHERGVLTLMTALRNAGVEVIYTGRYATPDGVAKMAAEEAADMIALSDHTGSMLLIAKQLVQALDKYKLDDVKIIAGGLIPDSDVPALEALGVTGNFGPGTPISAVIEHVYKAAQS